MKQGDLVMLHKINESYVKSDEGYSIKMGRQHLSYIENDGHSVTFSAEDMVNPFYLVIYLEGKDHYWHSPYQSEKLSSSDIEKIKIRINDVMNFLKIKYEIA